MPTAIDLAFVLLFAVIVTLIETVVFFPRFKAAVAAGKPNARRNGYRRTILGQWGFAVLGILLWAGSGRGWTQLGIVPPADGRMYVSAILVGVMGLLVF